MPKQKAKTQALLRKGSLALFFCLYLSPVFAGSSTPTIVSLEPSSGSYLADQSITLTTIYSDPEGWQHIQYAYLMINTSHTDPDYFFAVYYQNTNVISAKGVLGTFSPGSAKVIQSSMADIDCLKTTVSGSGDTLIIKWSITFKASFAGANKSIYLAAVDDSHNYSGWLKKGTCAVFTPQGTVTITSADNTVRLEISFQALDPRNITVKNLNLEGLKNAAPKDTTILAAAECKPDGLNFDKPLLLTYILPQAEIPGTLIKLGVFGASSGKFDPDLEKISAPVATDGYSVTFPITHFSSYAVLKSLISIGQPIGVGVKIPLPDLLTGSFSYTVPLTVPPGRKGMQPALSLTYRSSNPNSWVGLGFSLNPGYIVRSTRLGPAKYTDDDTFYFITDAGTTELVRLQDNLYQAKVESNFAKFFKKADDTWWVVGKDGSVLKFGQSSESKEGPDSAHTFSWYITRAVDTNGNYVAYQYRKETGKAYLEKIEYTGNENGIAPTNTLEFMLETDPYNRKDIITSYLSGSKISTTRRLKEIQASVKGDLVWRYVLDYVEPSPDTDRSLLRVITQYASDGKSFPRQKFEYQKNSP